MKKARNGFMNTLPYLCLVGVIVLGLMTIVGTGGGGGGGSAPSPTTCENVAGTWNTTEVVDARDCGEGTYTEYPTYTVTQTGCNITVTRSGVTVSGTVNGNTINWTGSYPEDGGTTYDTVSLTISGDNLSGSSSWTWTDNTDPTDTCSGTTQVSGTRTSGGGTGVSLADLAGTWYGVQEEPSGAVWHRISVTIDGSGHITQILVDGTNTGVTATLTKLSDQIFGYLDSENTEGGFYVDASARYAGFVDEDFYFVVVQKGASSLPTYAHTDIVGTWSGYGLALDSTGDIAATWTSSATVLGDFSFSGTNSLGATFNGSFPAFDSTYGFYTGTFTNNQGESGPIRGFLSPDKLFAASWAIDTSGASWSFPEDVSFELWNKQ
jgi:hypothetical protein